MANDHTIDIARLPLAVVRGAAEKWLGRWEGKTLSGQKLAESIKNGFITMEDIRLSTPMHANAQPDLLETAAVAAVEATAKAAGAVADRAEKSALDALHETSSLRVEFKDLSKRLDAATDAIIKTADSLRDKPIADPAAVADAVTAAVAAAFKPFEAAVVAAGAQATVGQMVAVQRTGQRAAVDVFGIDMRDSKGRQIMVDIFNDASCPAIDPNWVWSESVLRHILLSQNTGENLWFGGEKGTGKSDTVRQFAAATGRGYTRINFTRDHCPEDYIGAQALEGGNSVFKAGEFLQAFQTTGALILLDEITNADPARLAILNGLLEANSAVTIGGAVRKRAPNVLIFAADNTLTNGDESGRYSGTRTMNSALADRFARVVWFKHMALDFEIEAVTRHTGCSRPLAEHVLKAVHACRAKVESGDIIDAPSIRQAMAFVRAVDVLGVEEAWASAIGNRQPSESATAVAAIAAAYIDPAFIQSNI